MKYAFLLYGDEADNIEPSSPDVSHPGLTLFRKDAARANLHNEGHS